MEQDGKSRGKIIGILSLIAMIVAICANMTEISEFIIKMFDRYETESEKKSENEKLKEIQEDNWQDNIFNVDESGKIIFVQGTDIILRVKNNRELVTTDNKGYLQSKKAKVNSNSIYKIHNTPDDYSGLQGGYGFVRVAADEEDAPIYENADKIQKWECYEFFRHNEYVYIKCQANEKYITCALDEEGKRLYARGEGVQEWELFSVYVKVGDEWKDIFTGKEIEP